MIQSALPVAIFSNHNSSITMKGGTDVSFSPSMDYVKNVIQRISYFYFYYLILMLCILHNRFYFLFTSYLVFTVKHL